MLLRLQCFTGNFFFADKMCHFNQGEILKIDPLLQ